MLRKNCLSVLFMMILNILVYEGSSAIIDALSEYDVNSIDNSGPGKPLFLTPLIENGQISEARRQAVVKPLPNNVVSYAGYFTVNKDLNSNLFFWFFQADDKNWENLPVTVWLQGGPGASSLLGLFVENGPYNLVNDSLHMRDQSWHKTSNMIYIDNPVGSGFSFTDHDDGYARNQTIIGEQLYSAIKQFFIMFPNLVKNEFFISGESYAGKYVPSFAYTIYKGNALAVPERTPTGINDKVFINLKGLLIGNGLVDPPNMMKYGDYLYQLGLIDTNTLKQFHIYEDQIREAIKIKDWTNATEIYSKMVLQYVFYPDDSLFYNVTGFDEHYNFVNLTPLVWTSQHTHFVNSDLFRRSVHVGDRVFNKGVTAAKILKEDIMKSVINKVSELLNHYRIVFYNGQLDIICAYPLTVNFIKKMKFSSDLEYATAERHIWMVDSDIAGYYKTAGNLTEVLVRDAGHMVPAEQPLWAHILFTNFISNKDLNE